MALTKLGNYIEQTDNRNTDLKFNVNQLRGISINKILMPTKANTDDLNLKGYKVVKNNEFTYCTVTSRNGNKISLAYNDGEDCIVSSINPTFKIKDEAKLLPRFLMMYFNRAEFDRYARFNSWGSARETFTWDDMCDIEIDLPSIEIQKKYVAVYESLLSNLRSYESKLEDLKLVCDGYIEDLRKKYGVEKIGKYIFKGSKNSDEKITNVLGIGQNGFISPQKKPNESLSNYKILKKGYICYAPPIFNILSDAIGIYEFDELAVCSPIYETFSCDGSVLNPKFLLMWLKRHEFKRYAEFYALGVRNTFDYDLMREFRIPIPPIEIQKSIVNVFDVCNKRKDIINKLKEKISTICPILIRGAIKEGEEQDARL